MGGFKVFDFQAITAVAGGQVIHSPSAGPDTDISARPRFAITAANLDAPQKFEAYLIQTMIEQMLPAAGESTFGSGFSGGAWRSMMAARVADVVASHGGLGIASRILRSGHQNVGQR